MPRDSKGRPVLNKPFKGKSTPASKKYSVYVKSNNKKGYKTIHFGARGMDDWRSGKATYAYKDKTSPAYWSLNYLW